MLNARKVFSRFGFEICVAKGNITSYLFRNISKIQSGGVTGPVTAANFQQFSYKYVYKIKINVIRRDGEYIY